MRRREFIALVGAAVTLSFTALALEQGRTYRLGVLVPECRDTPARIALFDEVNRLGFVEGVNFARECREFGGKSEAASEYAAALVKSKVDVIYALGDTAIRAAQGATSTIPILGSTNDMLEAGLVKSLARPEGNTTGTSFFSIELDGKRQEILIEALPGIKHIAALADSTKPLVCGLRHCRMRRALATSSSRLIKSSDRMKSLQPLMLRRRRARLR